MIFDFELWIVPYFFLVIWLIVGAGISTAKSAIIFFPLFSLSLILFYPHTVFIYIPTMVLWLLVCFGSGKASAFTYPYSKMPKWFMVLQVVLALACGYYLTTVYRINTSPSENVMSYIGRRALQIVILSIAVLTMLYILIAYVLCPIFVIKKTEMRNTLVDYWAIRASKRASFHVQFKNDSDSYTVSYHRFQRMRGKIGTMYSYTKCFCVLNTVHIRKLRLAGREFRGSSAWEKKEIAERPKRMRELAIVLGIVLLLMVSAFILHNYLAK